MVQKNRTSSSNNHHPMKGRRSGTAASGATESVRVGSLVLVWIATACELGLDLVTTVIAFLNFIRGSECCGEAIDLGIVPLAIAVPYCVLVLAELGMLVATIRYTVCRSVQQKASCLKRVLGWMVIVNPFFGFMVAWTLLYQSSKSEAFIVLGLEAGSLFLAWLAIYLEGKLLDRCTIILHLIIPGIPFVATVVAMIIYIRKGGVCYRDGNFWYEGCTLCRNGKPSEAVAFGDGAFSKISTWTVTSTCADGSKGRPEQTYCGTDTQFCWFSY